MKMRKEYQTPELHYIELEDEIAVINSSNIIGSGDGEVPDEDPNAARGSRGEWGSLWG